MAEGRENSGEIATVVLVVRILLVFIALGALGALCGTLSVRLLYGRDFAAGVKEGFILLFVSSCLGLPGVYLLRNLNMRCAEKEDGVSRENG